MSTREQPELPGFRYHRTQAQADALVAEALDEFPPKPDLSMRANAVRLLAAMWYCQGSTDFPRGWVRSAMQAFIDRDIDCPNARCWRSYRSNVQDNPGQFLPTPGVPTELLLQMENEVLAVA